MDAGFPAFCYDKTRWVGALIEMNVASELTSKHMITAGRMCRQKVPGGVCSNVPARGMKGNSATCEWRARVFDGSYMVVRAVIHLHTG